MKSTLKLAFVALLSIFVAHSAAFAQETADKDIVQTATDAGNFTIFTKALNDAGLAGTLQGAGPYTVFAPTDDAFAKLPEGKLDELMANPEALRALLLFHVVEGNVASADVAAMSSATTVEGSNLTITNQGGVKINGAGISQADVAASNGVIHAIDTVLLPPSLQ